MAWTSTVVLGIWVACMALVFQAVGFAIPFWISMSVHIDGTKDYWIYISVWYVMSCIKGESSSCESKGIVPKFKTSGTVPTSFTGTTQSVIVTNASELLGYVVAWSTFQIIATVAVGLTALAVLVLICCRCAGIHSRGYFILACFLLLFGGGISLGTSILVLIGYTTVFSFTTNSIDADTFPWSLLLFGIGSLFGLLASVIFMVITCKWRRYGAYYESGSSIDGDMHMSRLSKRSHDRGNYDRPRQKDYYPESSRQDYYDRDRNGYDYYGGRNYRDSGRPDYREYENRGYEKSNDRSYDRGYEKSNDRSYDRGYDQSYDYKSYDRGYDRSYRPPADNMYRPYSHRRY